MSVSGGLTDEMEVCVEPLRELGSWRDRVSRRGLLIGLLKNATEDGTKGRAICRTGTGMEF